MSLRLIRRILSDRMRTSASSRKRIQLAGRLLLVLALLIARGEKPGQWLVAFRDYESAHFEAFGLRAECK